MSEPEIDQKWKAETEEILRKEREATIAAMKKETPEMFHEHLGPIIDLLARHGHEGMIMGLEAAFKTAKEMGGYDIAGAIRGRIRSEIAYRPEAWKKWDKVFED